MNTIKKPWIYTLVALMFAFASCESEDPLPENDEEVITDVSLIFTELDANGNPAGAAVTFTASDPQGIELGNPTIETVTLDKNKTYRMQITVFNSIENEDITEEIEEEADEHQFYFLGSAFVSPSAPITYTYSDNAVGLDGVVVVGSTSINTSNMRIILRHDLDKSYPGANNPSFEDFNLAGGSSDLDITFPVVLN